MNKVELDAITERIIGAAHRVSNTLGAGFVEKVYENAHANEMRKDGLSSFNSIRSKWFMMVLS